MTPSRFLQCPKCGYDLSAVQGDSGRCPECGGGFDRAAIVARQRATVSFSLVMIGVGILAARVADAVGMSFSFLPHATGGEHFPPTAQISDGHAAAQELSQLPILAAAYGVIVLASATSRDALQRWWPGIATGLFVSATLFSEWFTKQLQSGDFDWFAAPPWWSKLGMALPWSDGLFVLVVVLLLRRVVAADDMGRMRNAVRAVIWVACALLFMQLSILGLERYAESQGSMPLDETPLSWKVSGWLQSIRGTVIWLAWSCLGFLTLHVRTLWNSGSPARAIGT